jgi:hypothetical protein
MANSDDELYPNPDNSSSSDEESDQKSSLNLAGFLFGNIDRDGKLDDEDASYLDEASKKKLGGLSTVLGLKNIIDEEEKIAASNLKTEPSQIDDDYEDGKKVVHYGPSKVIMLLLLLL